MAGRRAVALLMVAFACCAALTAGPLAGVARAQTCTVSWSNTSGGDWNTASNWSTGQVPSSSDDVCLPDLGTSYTVTLQSSVTVDSLDIGAPSSDYTQTLEVEGGSSDVTLTLTNASAVETTGVLSLSGPSGWVDVTGATLTNDGSVTNSGAITLSDGAVWNQNGGSETGNPVTLDDGCTLTDAGTGASGQFDLSGSVTLSGTVAAGETVTVLAPAAEDSTATLSSPSVTNDGTIVLDSEGGWATVNGYELINNGTLGSKVGGDGNIDYLESSVANAGTIDVQTGNLDQDEGTTTTNDGTVIVGPTSELELADDSAVFNQHPDGTITFLIAQQSQSQSPPPWIYVSSGTFNLNGGTADPITPSDYSPSVGTEFKVISESPPPAGAFTTVEDGFVADYSETDGIYMKVGEPTTTSVTSSANPVITGQPVTFTATVTPTESGNGTPSGTVTFYDNGTGIGTENVSTAAGATTATLTTSSLSAGTHPITAIYNGDANFTASPPSGALNQVIQAPDSTTATLSSSANPATTGQPVTFTATVTPGPDGIGNPTGQVTFFDNGTSIGAGTVSTAGGTTTTATLTTSSLSAGTHPITAAYGGDANFASSPASSALDLVVNAPPPTSQGPPPVVLAAPPAATSSSAGTLSGLVNPDGLPTTAHWEYGLDPSERGPGFNGNPYDQSTSSLSVGSGDTAQPVSTPVASLLPDERYDVRLVATSSAGTTFGPAQTFTTPIAPVAPAPALGTKQKVTPVGTVFALEAGKFVRLTQTRVLPSGTEIDALHGSVDLVSAAAKKGQHYTGNFGGAVFKITQTRSGRKAGLTTLSLVEGAFKGAPSYAACKAKAAGDGSPVAGAALSGRVLATLRARAHGRFATRGRYAAGTVHGTRWTTTDRCDGTLIAVQVHAVLVTDFVKHITVLVHAGHSYLAKAT